MMAKFGLEQNTDLYFSVTEIHFNDDEVFLNLSLHYCSLHKKLSFSLLVSAVQTRTAILFLFQSCYLSALCWVGQFT